MILKRDTIQPFDFEGLSIYDFTAALDTRSSLARICVAPGARHRRAWSKECDKYYYVLSGQLQFMVDSQDYTLQEGDVCIVPHGHKFSYANTAEAPTEILLFHTPRFNTEAEVFDEE